MALAREKAVQERVPAPRTLRRARDVSRMPTPATSRASRKSAQRSAVRVVRGQTAGRAKAFPFQLKQRHSVGERIARTTRRGRSASPSRQIDPFPSASLATQPCAAVRKASPQLPKPARPAMFPANTSRALFYLPQCFPSASASGKFEQRRVRVVTFGLAVSIFPLPTCARRCFRSEEWSGHADGTRRQSNSRVTFASLRLATD